MANRMDNSRPERGDGVRDQVQNLKDDLNAQAPAPGVQSGIESGPAESGADFAGEKPRATPAQPGRSDQSSPVRDVRQDQYGDKPSPGRGLPSDDDSGVRERPNPYQPSKTDY